jgi:hypothetical protein
LLPMQSTTCLNGNNQVLRKTYAMHARVAHAREPIISFTESESTTTTASDHEGNTVAFEQMQGRFIHQRLPHFRKKVARVNARNTAKSRHGSAWCGFGVFRTAIVSHRPTYTVPGSITEACAKHMTFNVVVGGC